MRLSQNAGSKRPRSSARVALARATKQFDVQAPQWEGATGLEPATSGVTGRSWSRRSGRGSAGITGASRAFQPPPCGVRRAPAGASGDLLRDEREMLRCLSGKRLGSAREAVVVLVAAASPALCVSRPHGSPLAPGHL